MSGLTELVCRFMAWSASAGRVTPPGGALHGGRVGVFGSLRQELDQAREIARGKSMTGELAGALEQMASVRLAVRLHLAESL